MSAALKILAMSETEQRLMALYGPTMDVIEVAEMLSMTRETIYTLRAIGRFDITMFTGARRKLVAYTRDVAEHMDKRREAQMRADAALAAKMAVRW